MLSISKEKFSFPSTVTLLIGNSKVPSAFKNFNAPSTLSILSSAGEPGSNLIVKIFLFKSALIVGSFLLFDEIKILFFLFSSKVIC